MERGRPRVAFATLGCKLNQFETEAMRSLCLREGVEVVPFEGEADVYVVNTCTVTAEADRQSRQLARRAGRRNPAARVVLAGCYPQADPEGAGNLPGVDLVLGNTEKLSLPGYLSLLNGGPRGRARVFVGEIDSQTAFVPLAVERFTERTRAILKVQDGCDFACAFCLTTHARGPSRSLPPGEVLRQARALAGAGYREVVLTGVHLGAYGHDLASRLNLAELLRRLLRVGGFERLRLSSVEPREFTEELIRVIVASQGGRPRVCRHFHIPLEHGSDRVLRAMGRNYTSSLYARRVGLLRRLLPDAALGADVMVGFPGEGEEEFVESYEFLRSLPLTYLHVFPYSPRPGTRAAEMEGEPPPPVKRRRAAILRALDREKRAAFRMSQLGREAPVLIESRRDRESGLPVGMTENYLKVLVECPEAPAGEEVRVRLEAAPGRSDALRGVPLR